MCVYQDMVSLGLTIFINTMNGFNKPFNKPSRDVVNIVDSALAMEEGAQLRREEMLVWSYFSAHFCSQNRVKPHVWENRVSKLYASCLLGDPR